MPSRRTVIKSLAAAAMPMMAGCALPSAGKRSNYTLSGTALRRVNVSEERIIRTVAGLRPFRRNGFNVSAVTIKVWSITMAMAAVASP